MSIVDRVRVLSTEKGLTLAELERKLNFSNSSIRRWDERTPGVDKVQKVANFFDVSVDYILGNTKKKRYYDLTDKEKKDIAIQAEELLNGLNSKAETNYYGEPLDEEDKQKLHDAIELALALTKVKAKKKFTPKKYRDENSNK